MSLPPDTRHRVDLDHRPVALQIDGDDLPMGQKTEPRRRQADVSILDVYQGAASAKVIAADWVDYLHLVRWNGRWVIINVLGELKPRSPAKTW